MRRFTSIDALAVLSTGAFARVEVELSATNQAAQRHFESGVSFYRNGDYESARIEFGNRLSKLPDFLVNLCQVADKQNRIQEAINYCEQYLRIESNAKDNPEVLARLERLHQQLGGVVVPQPTPVAQTSSAPTPIAIASSQPTDANPARSRPPADALALLSGSDVLPFGGGGRGAGALLTAKEIEAGPAFDDLAGLQQRGAVLNAG